MTWSENARKPIKSTYLNKVTASFLNDAMKHEMKESGMHENDESTNKDDRASTHCKSCIRSNVYSMQRQASAFSPELDDCQEADCSSDSVSLKGVETVSFRR